MCALPSVARQSRVALSYINCLYSYFVKVDFRTNPLTYSSYDRWRICVGIDFAKRLYKHFLRDKAVTAAERGGDSFKRVKNFHQKVRIRIWSWLSYVCRVRSTADSKKNSWNRMYLGKRAENWVCLQNVLAIGSICKTRLKVVLFAKRAWNGVWWHWTHGRGWWQARRSSRQWSTSQASRYETRLHLSSYWSHPSNTARCIRCICVWSARFGVPRRPLLPALPTGLLHPPISYTSIVHV